MLVEKKKEFLQKKGYEKGWGLDKKGVKRKQSRGGGL